VSIAGRHTQHDRSTARFRFVPGLAWARESIVGPKDLQNLVQFKVLRPIRRDNFYWFDNRLLLEAKVALYLKDSLGTSTEVLALFTRALSSLKNEEVTTVRYLSLRSRPGRG
jgi:hypothetical protein